MTSPGAVTSKKTAFCVGVIATLCQVHTIPFTQVTPQRCKKLLTGRNKIANKILNEAIDELYPELWPILKSAGVVPSLKQHSYDAVAVIHTCWDDEHFVAVRRMMR